MLTDTQKKFLEVSKRIETLKEEMKALYPTLDELMVELGVGTHFQDPETKLVYQIVVPKGSFIEYKQVGYERTKKTGETKGSMAMKKAEELGYSLK